MAPEVIHAFDSDARAALHLGKDDRPLEDRLYVTSEARGSPCHYNAGGLYSRSNIGFDDRYMPAHIHVACLADCRMGVVGLLHHRPEETGGFWQISPHYLPAQIDIAEETFDRVWQGVVAGGREGLIDERLEVLDSGNCQFFLTGEMVKERPLCDASGATDVIHGRCRIAFCSNLMHRRVKQPIPDVAWWSPNRPLSVHEALHTNWSVIWQVIATGESAGREHVEDEKAVPAGLTRTEPQELNSLLAKLADSASTSPSSACLQVGLVRGP
jgi:hypothetical protein